MYMAHGGTNFGLTAGYNTVTSYDYNAPINEQGSPADKYHIFRSILANFTKQSLPAIP
jgi:beta-galactosidase